MDDFGALMANLVFTLSSGASGSWTTTSASGIDITLPDGGTETVTLDAAHPYGQDASGRLVVNTDTAGAITGFSTPSTQVSGDWVHGAGINPYGDTQPFDERCDGPLGNSGIYTYTDGDNVDPGRTGSAISWTAGERKVVVKAISRTGIPASSQCLIQDYIVINLMPSSDCFDGMYAPGPADPTAPVLDSADIDTSILLNSGTKPDASFPTKAQIDAVLPRVTRPDFLGCTSGQNLRRIQNFRYIADGDSTPTYEDYSADTAPRAAVRLWALHYLSGADREAEIHYVIRRGLDLYAAYRQGFTGRDGAGQANDFGVADLHMAALLLGDSDLLGAAQNMLGIVFDRPYEVQESDVGTPVNYDQGAGQNNLAAVTARSSDVGKPWNQETFAPAHRGFNVTARYSTIGLVPACYEGFPVLLCGTRSGLGVDGVAAACTGRSRNGILGIYDRLQSLHPSVLERPFAVYNTFPGNLRYDLAIDAWRSNVSGYGWTGAPDPHDVLDQGDYEFFSPATGGVSWVTDDDNFNGNQTITDRRVGLSIDGVQWTDYDGQAESGSLDTPTVDEPYYCSFAKQNANGWGERSYTHPGAFSGTSFTWAEDERNVVTPGPTGSETAAAPTRVTQPKLHVLLHPDSGTPVFWKEPADGATLATNETRVWIGAGLQEAHPAPTRTFTLQYEDVDLSGSFADVSGSGQDNDTSSLSPSLAGKRIRGKVEITNASGTLTEYTQIVRVV